MGRTYPSTGYFEHPSPMPCLYSFQLYTTEEVPLVKEASLLLWTRSLLFLPWASIRYGPRVPSGTRKSTACQVLPTVQCSDAQSSSMTVVLTTFNSLEELHSVCASAYLDRWIFTPSPYTPSLYEFRCTFNELAEHNSITLTKQ